MKTLEQKINSYRKSKKVFRVGETLISFGFLFWLIETLLFLFIDGWHLKATHPLEILCDAIASFALSTALFLIIYASTRIVEILLLECSHDEFIEILKSN